MDRTHPAAHRRRDTVQQRTLRRRAVVGYLFDASLVDFFVDFFVDNNLGEVLIVEVEANSFALILKHFQELVFGICFRSVGGFLFCLWAVIN